MSYINQIFKEVDDANAAMYEHCVEHVETRSAAIMTLMLKQIQAINRLKMNIEASLREVPQAKLDQINNIEKFF